MKIREKIIERIKREGPLTFETFMDMALYHPGLGYYSTPGATIGREGDFYTSSHLHPIFGAMIGRQLMEMWKIMGRPDDFRAVEIGAGIGYLTKDIFDYLQRHSKDKSNFLKSFHYVIVEPYEHFKDRQIETLGDILKNPPHPASLHEKAELTRKISWVGSLGELNEGISGCIFSNELLDAFPVHIVEVEETLKEVFVDFDGEEFIETKGSLSSEEIAGYLKHFSPDIPSGYRTEINLRIKGWLQEITKVLSRGFLLTVDYGYSAREYYSDDRTTGTLLCYHKHLFNEKPYQNIGEQDITAHVNFSSLKEWGEDVGFKTIGYCSQGTFLVASGIDEIITELYSDSPDYLYEVSKIKGLIMPQGMGASHNFMIQYKGEGLPGLRGFSMRNLKGSL